MKRELVVPRTEAATKLHAVLASSTRARVYKQRCSLFASKYGKISQADSNPNETIWLGG